MGARTKRVGSYALRVAVGAVALTALTGGETTILDDFAEYNGLPVLALPIVVLLVLNTSESVEL